MPRDHIGQKGGGGGGVVLKRGFLLTYSIKRIVSYTQMFFVVLEGGS
jgi:hypothetical protein